MRRRDTATRSNAGVEQDLVEVGGGKAGRDQLEPLIRCYRVHVL
jgi:hypothetical protein